MFIFVDVGYDTCKSAYTLFVSKVSVAVAQFLYELHELDCDGYAVLLIGGDSDMQCHGVSSAAMNTLCCTQWNVNKHTFTPATYSAAFQILISSSIHHLTSFGFWYNNTHG
jgi:hypothetical protein